MYNGGMCRGLALVAGAVLVLGACGRIGFGVGDSGGADGRVGGGGDGAGADAWPAGTERCNGIDDDGDDMIDEGVCPATCGGIVREGRSYMLCTTSITAVEARALCAASGMHLIRIDDAAENLFVRSLVDPLPNPQAWIGATDEAVEREWRWADGTQFWQGNQTGAPVGGLFSAWASGHPADQQGATDCAESIPVDALWLDAACNDAATIDVAFCEQ